MIFDAGRPVVPGTDLLGTVSLERYWYSLFGSFLSVSRVEYTIERARARQVSIPLWSLCSEVVILCGHGRLPLSATEGVLKLLGENLQVTIE